MGAGGDVLRNARIWHPASRAVACLTAFHERSGDDLAVILDGEPAEPVLEALTAMCCGVLSAALSGDDAAVTGVIRRIGQAVAEYGAGASPGSAP